MFLVRSSDKNDDSSKVTVVPEFDLIIVKEEIKTAQAFDVFVEYITSFYGDFDVEAYDSNEFGIQQ